MLGYDECAVEIPNRSEGMGEAPAPRGPRGPPRLATVAAYFENRLPRSTALEHRLRHKDGNLPLDPRPPAVALGANCRRQKSIAWARLPHRHHRRAKRRSANFQEQNEKV